MSNKKEEYNNVPVLVCKRCLSLAIKGYNDALDYCNDCGSTNIIEMDIKKWNTLYIHKYGEPFLTRE